MSLRPVLLRILEADASIAHCPRRLSMNCCRQLGLAWLQTSWRGTVLPHARNADCLIKVMVSCPQPNHLFNLVEVHAARNILHSFNLQPAMLSTHINCHVLTHYHASRGTEISRSDCRGTPFHWKSKGFCFRFQSSQYCCQS